VPVPTCTNISPNLTAPNVTVPFTCPPDFMLRSNASNVTVLSNGTCCVGGLRLSLTHWLVLQLLSVCCTALGLLLDEDRQPKCLVSAAIRVWFDLCWCSCCAIGSTLKDMNSNAVITLQCPPALCVAFVSSISGTAVLTQCGDQHAAPLCVDVTVRPPCSARNVAYQISVPSSKPRVLTARLSSLALLAGTPNS
jgi:hypothetical protein